MDHFAKTHQYSNFLCQMRKCLHQLEKALSGAIVVVRVEVGKAVYALSNPIKRGQSEHLGND